MRKQLDAGKKDLLAEKMVTLAAQIDGGAARAFIERLTQLNNVSPKKYLRSYRDAAIAALELDKLGTVRANTPLFTRATEEPVSCLEALAALHANKKNEMGIFREITSEEGQDVRNQKVSFHTDQKVDVEAEMRNVMAVHDVLEYIREPLEKLAMQASHMVRSAEPRGGR